MYEGKLLITGAGGQLGQALQLKYPMARTADITDLDITDIKSVMQYPWDRVNTLINAAAFTNVDGAETSEGRIKSWQVNAQAVANLMQAVLKNDLTIIHFSTDYVFDGSKQDHREAEPYSPLSVYASTKTAGDIIVSIAPKHYLLRTSWVIGDGKNFVRTMLGLGKKGISPAVVDDQIGRLTFTSELVRAIDHLLTKKAPYGTYNVTNDGKPSSWASITESIFKEAGYNLKVIKTSTAEYYTGKEGIAPRPLNSSLNLSKLHSTGFVSRNWKDDLREYIKKETGR